MKAVAITCIFALAALGAQGAIFTEDWESGFDSSVWSTWGWPSPVLSSASHAQGAYSLDPNGDGSYLSGVISTERFTPVAGMQLSVQAYIESAQSWSELEFGLASATQIDSTPVYSEYNYVTLFIDADNQGIGPQMWDYYRTGQGAASNGSTTQVNGASLTGLFDGWHTFTFTFTEAQSIEIAIDGVAFNASPDNWYDAATDEFSIYLGGRSYGATENLYDQIELSVIPEPSTALLMGITTGGIVLVRRKFRA